MNCHNNKHKAAVLEELHKAAAANHVDADCFVCIFMTHGEERQISTYDHEIEIKEITDLFRGDQCKSLAGKPKIFIFQLTACTDNKYEDAVTGMMAGDDDEEEEEEEKAVKNYTIPAGADFLMCYSVAEGFYSFRSPELVNLKVSRHTADLGTVKNKKTNALLHLHAD